MTLGSFNCFGGSDQAPALLKPQSARRCLVCAIQSSSEEKLLRQS